MDDAQPDARGGELQRFLSGQPFFRDTRIPRVIADDGLDPGACQKTRRASAVERHIDNIGHEKIPCMVYK
jgi:hypothetical protein